MKKKAQIRWGNLDAVSAVLVLAGVFLLNENGAIGLVLISLGIIKQLSGR